MFRFLFRSRSASRSQTRTRSQVSFKPKLESLESRYVPSTFGSFDHDNVVVNVDLNNTNAVTVIQSPGARTTSNLIGQNTDPSGHHHHEGG